MNDQISAEIDWSRADDVVVEHLSQIATQLGLPVRLPDGTFAPDGVELLLGQVRMPIITQGSAPPSSLPVHDIHRLALSRHRLDELILLLVTVRDQYDKIVGGGPQS